MPRGKIGAVIHSTDIDTMHRFRDHAADETPLPGVSDRERSIRRRVHRLAEFYQHLVVYLLVNAGLWSINAWQVYQTQGSRSVAIWWALWPTLGWGIGLVVHGLSVLPGRAFLSRDWEERKVRELLERERR